MGTSKIFSEVFPAAHMMVAVAYKSFRLPESRPHYPPQKDFHTSHVKIELSLDFVKHTISGACTLTIEPVRSGVNHVRLDACHLEIAAVKVDDIPADFQYEDSTLLIALDEPLTRNRAIRVDYSAVPQDGVFFTEPDKEHPEKEIQAWTHTEAEASRYWFPCHDHPEDKSTSELVLRVPKEFRVISNGKLLSTSTEGETAVFHWKEDAPHSTYLTSFVAGKFGQIEQEVDGIKLRYNFPESKREDVMRYFGETPRIIRVLGELTGMKYPYEKYDQTTVQDFVAGGEENINATTFSTNYYPDETSEEDFQTSYSAPHVNAVDLVAHEAAHQWFGDLVTCSDWAHAWLNEGFATYFQVLYLEKSRGVDQMRWDLSARMEEYFEEDEHEYRRPIVDRDYVWPDDLFDEHLYPKAAAMLHELRFVMGDDSFFRGINSFLKTFSYSKADTQDLLKSMVYSSGLQLEEFFEQSFFKAGHPEFEVTYSWEDEKRAATLRVRQAQKTDDGTPVFKLPCEIVFYVEGKRLNFVVNLDSAEQTLTFMLPSKPSVVEFDPRRWLLKKVKFDKGIDLLLSQLESSQDAWSRGEAAKELGKLKSNRAIANLNAAAVKEQFWHVRASALEALGAIGSEDALKALLDMDVPKNRRVRRGLAKALGEFKDERARTLLLSLLRKDESPYVRCEAALALAKSWPEGALPHLKDAMKVHSPNETLAEACLDAMGKLGDSEVKDIVKKCLVYGNPTRVRIGALKAIKGRGYVLDEEVPKLKEIILHDQEFRVRLHLINQVVRPLGDRRFIEEVREAAGTGRELKIRRKALETYHELALSAEHSALVSNLRAEVEGLKEENRRLAGAQS
ncbi:MAG TPA: M1 family metallopeptidase [Nitrososphaerales archaeon]|nr:M1 family metallopeptidase [Nitrososphaerales archaeon]